RYRPRWWPTRRPKWRWIFCLRAPSPAACPDELADQAGSAGFPSKVVGTRRVRLRHTACADYYFLAVALRGSGVFLHDSRLVPEKWPLSAMQAIQPVDQPNPTYATRKISGKNPGTLGPVPG